MMPYEQLALIVVKGTEIIDIVPPPFINRESIQAYLMLCERFNLESDVELNEEMSDLAEEALRELFDESKILENEKGLYLDLNTDAERFQLCRLYCKIVLKDDVKNVVTQKAIAGKWVKKWVKGDING